MKVFCNALNFMSFHLKLSSVVPFSYVAKTESQNLLKCSVQVFSFLSCFSFLLWFILCYDVYMVKSFRVRHWCSGVSNCPVVFWHIKISTVVTILFLCFWTSIFPNEARGVITLYFGQGHKITSTLFTNYLQFNA
jgi:hypothetical protein